MWRNRTQVLDNGVQEITPQGAVVWTWWASEHIPPIRGSNRLVWCDWTNSAGRDPFHINSIEPDGNGYVMSFRHLDAVYKVSGPTAASAGSSAARHGAESLTVLNDPVAGAGDTLRAQHDARILADGT